MILSDKRILEEIEKGTIKVAPYDRECLGSNSYDVHLGKWLATYNEHILDAKKHNLINISKSPTKDLFCIPIYFIWLLHRNTQRRMHTCPSWKVNLQPVVWESIYTPQQAKAM